MHENLIALEQSTWDPSVRKDPARWEAILSPDFFEFGSSGAIWTKKDVIERIPHEMPVKITTTDLRSYELSKGVVLLTYRARKTDAGGSLVESLRSSIWKETGGRWQMFFHQSTPVRVP